MVEDRTTAPCAICEGEFYAIKLVNGKCENCQREFPMFNTKEEVLEDLRNRQARVENRENEDSFDNRVERKVMEVLEKIGALSACECGQKFFRRSPNQKTCGNCGKVTE